MLYCEFLDGTKCGDNEYSYQIYKELEKIYMDSNISKEDVYKFVDLLIDNVKLDVKLKILQSILEKTI